MCKAPNKSKITTFLRQCLTSASAKADLSALYSPSDLSVEQVELEDMRTYHVYARCNLPHGVCPYCGHVSRSVHSRYHRNIADLSILGHPVIITFEARKFFCHNPDCRGKTFAEQPGEEVFRYRRRTRRCDMAVTQHGLKCSSESVRKLLSAIGVPLSGDTVLRNIHRMSVCELPLFIKSRFFAKVARLSPGYNMHFVGCLLPNLNSLMIALNLHSRINT